MYMHRPIFRMIPADSPRYRFNPDIRYLPTLEAPFLLLPEGVNGPPGWYLAGEIRQPLYERYCRQVFSATTPEEWKWHEPGLINAWLNLPLTVPQPEQPRALPFVRESFLSPDEARDYVMQGPTTRAYKIYTHFEADIIRMMIDQSPWVDGENITTNLALTSFPRTRDFHLGPEWIASGPDITSPDSGTPSPRSGRRVSILCWNCRGARHNGFVRQLLELLTIYEPGIIIISNTLISGAAAEHLSGLFGFTNSVLIDPLEHGGGVWVLWNSYKTGCEVLSVSHRQIHAFLQRGPPTRD